MGNLNDLIIIVLGLIAVAAIWSFTVIVLRMSNKLPNDPYEPRDRDQ